MRDRGMPWFRFYRDHLDNPDYLVLDDRARVIWTELLCLAAEANCGILRRDTLARRLRRHPNQIAQAILALTRVGWVGDPPGDLGGDHLGIVAWSDRQIPSDHSGGDRSRKWRESRGTDSKRDVARDVARDARATAQTETETETSSVLPAVERPTERSAVVAADASLTDPVESGSGNGKKSRKPRPENPAWEAARRVCLEHFRLCSLPGEPSKSEILVVKRCLEGGLSEADCMAVSIGAIRDPYHTGQSPKWPGIKLAVTQCFGDVSKARALSSKGQGMDHRDNAEAWTLS